MESVSLERNELTSGRYGFMWMFIVCLSWTSVADGGQSDNNSLHTLILAGIQHTLNQSYPEADSLFRLTAREFPEHPAGYLYQAAVMQSRAMDYELQIEESRFDSLLELGVEKAEYMIKRDPSSPWGHFFLGMAYGYDSYARVYRGNWFGGALKGFSAVSEFKKAIALDSTLYDAYAGIGTFYYWRSRRTEYFNWLPFLGDDREKGYNYVDQTIRFGVYNRYTAITALTGICLDAERYEQAEQVARMGLERYPRNRIFLFALATALDRGKRYRQAAEAYERLLESIVDDGNNHYNEIVCRLNLVKMKMALSDTSGVRDHLELILSYEQMRLPEHLQARAKDKFLQARAIARTLAVRRN